MKNEVYKYFLISIALIGLFLIGAKFNDAIETFTNYTSQQLDNWLWGDNYSSSTHSGLYNSSDSTLSVRIKSGSVTISGNVKSVNVPDSITHWQSHQVNTADTINFKNIYHSSYIFSVTSGPIDSTLVKLFKIGGIDTVRLGVNETYTSNYLNPTIDTAISVGQWTGGYANRPAYRQTSQGK